MTTVRCQAVFQGGTLLPEDQFVNTFHFHEIGSSVSYEDSVENVHLVVGSFYNQTLPGPDVALGTYISPFVGTEFVTKCYDLELPAGEREPDEFTHLMPGVRLGTGMPEEVAICLTIAGFPPVTPRRRGRVYIGPLSQHADVIDQGDGDSPSRVNLANNGIGHLLALAAVRLQVDSDMAWCIRSVTPAENFVQVQSGWIDNAFDIQRRRGPDPTERRAWSVP